MMMMTYFVVQIVRLASNQFVCILDRCQLNHLKHRKIKFVYRYFKTTKPLYLRWIDDCWSTETFLQSWISFVYCMNIPKYRQFFSKSKKIKTRFKISHRIYCDATPPCVLSFESPVAFVNGTFVFVFCFYEAVSNICLFCLFTWSMNWLQLNGGEGHWYGNTLIKHLVIKK